uniref:SH2 domain-containing protein n=2 Tax=Graphocephala atropunctata TaxID=36148 RepID=A0A1B6MKK1_9HEMI
MRMKCACVQAVSASYERLPSVATSMGELSNRYDDKENNDKDEMLVFFNDDDSYQTVLTERNLCCSDLCALLAVKNRVAKDVNWTVVEHWIDAGLERNLEDHEEVLAVHRELEAYSQHSPKRFIFRKDFRKYEFFANPQQFFPEDMVDLSAYNNVFPTNGPTTLLQTLVTTTAECPPVFSQVWVREPHKQVWAKAFLLLKDKNLYLSYKVQIVAKFLRQWRVRDNSLVINQERIVDDGERGNLQLFARLSDFNIYTTINAKNHLRAPTEFGLCLRAPGQDDPAELRCLACENDRARTCWLTAMRLAKYGKQLRENYRAFKNKQQMETLNPRDYSSYTVPNESVRSRVAMDFTGPTGRIVEDPKEARAIALAEGNTWKKKLRNISKMGVTQGIESGVHITQPWFHSGMTRDQATQLVNKHGTVDGVFLVRDSRTTAGQYVLTFKCGGKVFHMIIVPVTDPGKGGVFYSLDNGATKFYDLLQLVEFYQLNAGCLPTRLTHYLVESPTGPLYSDKPTVPSV